MKPPRTRAGPSAGRARRRPEAAAAAPAAAGVARVTLLGLPTDSNSSYRRGAAAGPAAIRRALASPAGNSATETGADLTLPGAWHDAGDLPLTERPADRVRIERAVRALLERGSVPLLLGGDHSVTYPILRAVAAVEPAVSILHFDAHPDLYDEFEGRRFSHACPFARIMEAGLARRLVQVGIRTLNAHQARQARRFGVEIVPWDRFAPQHVPLPSGPLYVSIDLDALDPAFAPGVAHPEPGGLSVREVLAVLHRVRGRVVGADVVELLPAADERDRTAGVAAKLVKELAGLVLRRDDARRR